MAIWNGSTLKGSSRALVLFLLACGSAAAQLGGRGLVTASSTQNPFFGGVTTGTATGETLDLSLRDALDRGLRFNLGLLLSTQSTAQARATRLSSLANLLPSVNGHVAQTEQQTNLAAMGVPASFLRGMSPIVGPFPVFDTRASLTESISLRALNRLHADTENLRAANFNLRNARDLVVLFVGGGYIQALSAQSRIEAIQAQVTTAQSLYDQALDMKKAGTIAGIDVLRAKTELQIQQQRLVAAKNDFEKAKLQLAHAIGMPQAQSFRLTSAVPYQAVPLITLDHALDRAFRSRSDYQSALVLKRSAELTRKAAVSSRLPSLQFSADYGILGNTPMSSHGTFAATGAIVFPIFQSGRIKAEIQQADALLRQREAQAEDSRAAVEYDVRSAFLDLTSAAEQVEVARSSVGLATEQVQQARDRFAAGVTNNIEVIQAQEALAMTNENYIASLLAHNLAKLSLARALGVAETAVKEFLGGSL